MVSADDLRRDARRPLGAHAGVQGPHRPRALHALAGRARRASSSRLRLALALVDRGARGILGVDLGVLRACARQRPTSACSADRDDARRASGSRARGSTTPSTSSAARTTRPPAILPRLRAARAGSDDAGASCARRSARIAGGLRALGVGPGDRVVAYMPNIPETVVAFLACARIGAIWSSCSPDFGARSVVDRFAQIEPKVLLAVDGYRYGGKRLRPPRRRWRELAAGDAGARAHVVLSLPRRGTSGRREPCLGRAARRGAGELAFEQVPFDHPLWVLYSSGTTGLPKAIVHGPRRHPARAPQEAGLHLDLRPGRPDVLVHHHRLDDVELPGRRAAHGGARSCSTTAAPAIPTWARCGTWPSSAGIDLLRHQRRLHRARA